jgi:hypothetical protein
MPSPLEQCEDELGERFDPEALDDAGCDYPAPAPRELAGLALGLGHAMGDGRSPPGIWQFRRFGPPPIGRASR